jgi:DNA-directed RNA polymerase III subunit RPC6/RNA polymerase primary sigma factor/RNA exonuclease 1
MEFKKSISRKSKKSSLKMKGGQFIPTYTETSPGWHNEFSNAPYAVDLNVGINEYMFSRPTPDNKFVVSTGLINTPSGVEMIGGKKSKKTNKKDSEKKKSIKTIKTTKKDSEKKKSRTTTKKNSEKKKSKTTIKKDSEKKKSRTTTKKDSEKKKSRITTKKILKSKKTTKSANKSTSSKKSIVNKIKNMFTKK